MKLDKTKFEEWLKAKRPDSIVGKKRECCGCPLANFHIEIGGGEVVISENGNGYRIDRGYGEKLLPVWAEQFARMVDHGPTDKISARQALDILART